MVVSCEIVYRWKSSRFWRYVCLHGLVVFSCRLLCVVLSGLIYCVQLLYEHMVFALAFKTKAEGVCD